MSDQVRDMTTGSPSKLILLFAVPLMLGNVCQQLYTMVDTVIVGQIAGVQALAALGAVEWFLVYLPALRRDLRFLWLRITERKNGVN